MRWGNILVCLKKKIFTLNTSHFETYHMKISLYTIASYSNLGQSKCLTAALGPNTVYLEVQVQHPAKNLKTRLIQISVL